MSTNLDNLVEDGTGPELDSPRSLELCAAHGILPKELLQRPYSDFHTPGCTTSLQEKRAGRWEARREKRLAMLRAKRHAGGRTSAGEKGAQGHGAAATQVLAGLPSTGPDVSTMVAQEEAAIEKMQRRQAQELRQMMEHELKMSQMAAQNEAREKKEAALEQARKRERKQRARAAAERSRKQEIDRAAQERISDIKRAKIQEREHQKRLERAKLKEQKDAAAKRAAMKRARQRDTKKREMAAQTEAILERQRLEVERREEMMENRDRLRRERMRVVEAEAAQARSAKNARAAKRIVDARHQQSAAIERQRTLFVQKEQQAQQKRAHFEHNKRIKMLEAKKKADLKAAEIESVTRKMTERQEAKRDNIIARENAVRERMQRMDEEQKVKRARARQEQIRKNRERQAKYAQMQAVQDKKVADTMSELKAKQDVSDAVAKRRYEFLTEQAEEAQLRREEITEARERQRRLEEYKRNRIMQRMKEDQERMERNRKQRDALGKRRQAVAAAAKRQREETLAQFERMKVTKQVPPALQGLIDGIALRDEAMGQERGRGSQRPQSARGALPSVSGQASSAVNAIEPAEGADDGARAGAVAGAEAEAGSGTKAPAARGRPQPHPPAKGRPRLANAGRGGRNGRKATTRQRPHSASRSAPAPAPKPTPGSVQDGRQQVEALRLRQNEQLLRVLEEEQHSEQQREQMIAQVQAVSERRRLEKIFGIERAKASERIMLLTEEHEAALAGMLRELGMASRN